VFESKSHLEKLDKGKITIEKFLGRIRDFENVFVAPVEKNKKKMKEFSLLVNSMSMKVENFTKKIRELDKIVTKSNYINQKEINNIVSNYGVEKAENLVYELRRFNKYEFGRISIIDDEIGEAKILSGKTTPGKTNWKPCYEEEECNEFTGLSFYTNIEMPENYFSEKPLYFVSIGGSYQHWVIGASSIYHPDKDGFRIFIHPATTAKDFTPKSAADLDEFPYQWHVNWIAVGQ